MRHADRANGRLVGAEIARPPSIGETQMKQLLIAVTLVVAFAAPAMAENFVNPYATTLGR
jgi:hypothetical protein